jgi:hypothetical protein
MTAIIDTPIATTAAGRGPRTDARFCVTYLGLGGYRQAPLHQVADARLVTVTGTIIGIGMQGRTVWLTLRSADGHSGRIALDMTQALAMTPDQYGVGRPVRITGVARNNWLGGPRVAVRTLTAA